MIWTFLPRSFAQQLHVVVAGHAQGRAAVDHVAHEPQRVEDARPAVHQVADEDRLAALGVARRPARRRATCRRAAPRPRSPSRREQLLELVAAAVDVADDVERPVLARAGRSTAATARPSPPRPPRASPGRRRGGSPPCEAPQRAPELRRLVADDVRAEVPVGPARGCAPGRSRSGRSSTIATGRQWYCRASSTSGLRRLGLDVGGVDDRQPARRPAASPAMKCSTSKASLVADLVVLVVGDQPRQASDESTSVGRKCLRANVRLARAGRADQDDQRQLRDRRASSR